MIYLDNAASTHKKPKAVVKAMTDYLNRYASNSGRSGHKLSVFTGEKIYECREAVARLFGIDNPSRIAFTQNTTTALNFAIHGLITPGDHIVMGGMEHNAVVRPVASSGASYTVAKADKRGRVTADSVKEAINRNTKLIIINHTSNIVGTVSPIYEIGKLAREYNIPFLVDAAQSAGIIDIDVKRDNISMLAFAGHKLLYGPTGTGGLYVSEDISLNPIMQGGTGSVSESFVQPDFMPDILESGTPNTVGIIGLLQGVKYVLANGVNNLYNYEMMLTRMLRAGLEGINKVTVYGDNSSVGMVGFNIDNMDSVAVSNILSDRYNIASRGGLHCAALAHRSLGTENRGMVRFSVSSFTTEREIEEAVIAIRRLCI